MIEKSPDKSIGWMDMLAEGMGLISNLLHHPNNCYYYIKDNLEGRAVQSRLEAKRLSSRQHSFTSRSMHRERGIHPMPTSPTLGATGTFPT